MYKTAKDAVLFVIEVSQSMLAAPPASDSKKASTDTPTSAALKCAYSLMQQRIISSPNDMMGVLLYGTESSKFQSDEQEVIAYPHCYLLTDLDIPSADDVKALKALLDHEEEYSSLLVPSSQPVSMSNVLFCANQIFTTNAPNFSSRRLFIITDNDNPHATDRQLRNAAAVRAKDLYDLGVVIELFPISKPGHGFDRARFYDVRPFSIFFSTFAEGTPGHHIQCHIFRPFSASTAHSDQRPCISARWYEPPQLLTLLSELESRRSPCSLFEPSIRNRSGFQNLR